MGIRHYGLAGAYIPLCGLNRAEDDRYQGLNVKLPPSLHKQPKRSRRSGQLKDPLMGAQAMGERMLVRTSKSLQNLRERSKMKTKFQRRRTGIGVICTAPIAFSSVMGLYSAL